MNFTKEQIDYVKKTLDHIDFLTGSSRNSKTKQIIEELQQENARLKDNWNSLKDIAKSQSELKQQCRNGSLWFEIDELLNKMKEIEEN